MVTLPEQDWGTGKEESYVLFLARLQGRIFIHGHCIAGLAVARLQKVMVLFLLRRKKDSKLDGKNLIELPEKKIELIRLEFSEEEREIYNMVRPSL